jgi:hypothetical protein
VVGSLTPDLRTRAIAGKVAVLVTEGFGNKPMCEPVAEILSALHGQEAGINAHYQPRGAGATRPELFVPLGVSRMQESDESAEAKRPAAASGARVRGIAEPNLGRVGILPHDFVLQWGATEAGTHLPGVDVDWGDMQGEREPVPWTNLELIG